MTAHLHLHTEFSLLNGATRIKEAVAKAKADGMQALAITDYGNIFGAVEFFQIAAGAGIKPILGAEVFLPNYDDHRLKQYRRGQDLLWNLVLLVQNETGYINLSKMLTQSYLEGFYYKPRIDTALLQEYSEGLIALSAGFNGEIDHFLYNEDEARALEAAQKYQKIFPGRFYIELQENGLPGQHEINGRLIKIANQVGVPLVATNNVHYLNREDAEAFEVLRDIQMGRTIVSPHDHLKFTTDGYHFKTTAEMQNDFAYCPESISNIQNIVDACNYEFTFGKYHLPDYEVEGDLTLDEFLSAEAHKGLELRWKAIQLLHGVNDEQKKVYLDRLEHEVDVISKMGFSGYFLIVADFIKWAKANDIPVGPGRGSGAGSLVAYALLITDIDPIPYDLLFERFLNPERVSMPDFDIDFCQDRRGEVIEYVNKKYGNVSQIITFGKMKAKAVLRDVGRVMGLEYEVVDKIAKLIPNELDITLSKALEQEPDLKALHKNDETMARLIDVSLKLEGLNRHASVHAAGVIITGKPLWNFAPLYKGSKDDVVVQFDMKSAEKIGLIKFDFLGLKTLTVIKKAVDNIRKSQSIELDISTIPTNDEKVYETLINGDGCGIFQLESSGMRDLMKRLKPNCFEDIIALVALYRPGPLGSGMVDDFIERKRGAKEISYPFPQLEPILKGTYGVIVYQEQVMKISSELASYTFGEADILRRAMGKKKAEEMDAQRVRFLGGAKKNKLDEKKAEAVFDLMALFAEYGFNKSHSAAYALVSYQTAWLKTHYCTEYMAAIMSTEMDDTDKLQIFIYDCKQHGIEILKPDINKSDAMYSVEEPGKIRYGLAALKGVGSSAVEAIVEARIKEGPFKSLYDLCVRVDLSKVTKKVLDVLIKAGAFDSFGVTKKGMAAVVDRLVATAVSEQKSQALGQSDLFASLNTESDTPVGLSIDNSIEWSQNEVLAFEKEVFGLYFSSHPLEVYKDSLKVMATHNTMELSKLPRETTVTVGGTLLSQRTILTKKGQKMSFALLEDLSGKIEIIVFPRCYKQYGEILSQDQPLLVKGSVDHSDEGVKILVDSLEVLSDRIKENTRSVHLEIPYQELTNDKVQNCIDIIQDYKGQSLLYIHLKKENSFETIIEMPADCRVVACEPLQHRFNYLFDGKVVRFS